MPTHPVVLIDTSVLTNLLRVPGRDSDHEVIRAEFDRLFESGAKFVLPVTSVIETGNFVAQCGGDRRGAAERFVNAVTAAKADSPPWTIRGVTWDEAFFDALLAGDTTGSSLFEHLSAATLGAGDVAILVERDQLRGSTAYTDVRIWTLDGRLDAYN